MRLIPALVAATVQGSTETTFYVLAVYFGAVGIKRARHAVGCALLADLAGVIRLGEPGDDVVTLPFAGLA